MSARADGEFPAKRDGRSVAGGWVPVVLWMGVIMWLSGDRFSDEHTASWLAAFPFIRALGLPPAVFAIGHLIVRKCAHFVEYAVLSLLVTRAVETTRPEWSLLQRLLATVAFAALWAALDELHQATTLSRGASPADVLLDGAGAIAGAVAGAILVFRSPNPRPGSETST